MGGLQQVVFDFIRMLSEIEEAATTERPGILSDETLQ
jgi:hypothetical protein